MRRQQVEAATRDASTLTCNTRTYTARHDTRLLHRSSSAVQHIKCMATLPRLAGSRRALHAAVRRVRARQLNAEATAPQPARRPSPRLVLGADAVPQGSALKRSGGPSSDFGQTVLFDAPAAGSVAVGTRRGRSALGHAQRALQDDAGRARSPPACAEAPAHQLHPLVESASRARGRVISRSSGEAGRSEAAWGPPSKVPSRQA